MLRIAGHSGAVGLALGIAALWMGPAAMAQGGLAAYQGAWLSGGTECSEVYVSDGKGTSFKKSVDIFAPAFIVSGSRLRTPQASCRIKSVRPRGDRQTLVLDCANAVSSNEVRTLMAVQGDGSLKRFFNDQDTAGTAYKQCSR